MTKEEFASLKSGDIVRNKVNQSLKYVMPNGYPIEPIVSVSREGMEANLDNWEVYIKVCEISRVSIVRSLINKLEPRIESINSENKSDV